MTTPIVRCHTQRRVGGQLCHPARHANGASGEELWLLTIPAVIALAGSLGAIVSAAATPTRTWIVPLSIVAVWGVVFGGLIVASSLSAWSHYSDQASVYSELAADVQNSGSKGGDPATQERIGMKPG